MMRWICVGLGIIGFVVAYRVSGGNLLASLGLSLAPLTVLIGIERGLAAEKQRKASSLSEHQFMLQKAGGAKNLRQQATLIRVFSCLLVAIAVPTLVLGVVGAVGGSVTAFFIALAAALMLYGASVFLKAAANMGAAADGNEQTI
jgi:hypothetical protein